MASRSKSRPAFAGLKSGRWRTVSISSQLQYAAALVLAVIVGVAGQQLWHVRMSTISDTERQMARLDMVFAEQTGRAVETVDLLLRNTIETVQGPRGTLTLPLELNASLHRRIDGVRQITELMVTDAAGQLLASSSREPGSPLPLPLATEIARFAAAPQSALQFSEPFRGPNGIWTALMLRAIPGSGDSTVGLVIACLNLGYFEDFYKAVELNENGAILLHRRDGIVLARYPHNDSVIGTSYANLPPFRDILSKAQAGTVVMTSPIDGATRVLAIRALKAFPLAVNVSVDQSMIMAPWRQQAFVLGGVALMASVAVAALLLLLAQRSRQVEVLVGEFRGAKETAERATARLLEQMAERERAEAALRQAQRIEVVGQLTGGVAHDFNNLLTVVLGNLDVLEASAPPDSGQRPLLGIVRSAAERGAALTAQLLAFARRQPLVPSSVDVGAVMTGMSGLLHSALGSRINLVMRLDPNLWPAMIDPTQVELLVLNLAINARDAMPDGGTLTITVGNAKLGPPERPEQPQAGEYVRVVIADTGTGMTPEVLAKVFEPFFTTKGPGRGSGLGLSQVYGVVRQSGGGVQIETAARVGTAVTVFLPRAALAPTQRPLPAADGPATRSSDIAVLLVDDDAAVRQTTAQLLRHLGYRVTEADSGPMALGVMLGGAVPDVVLTDVAMPGMSGPELANRLLQDWPQLPVVFFSGYADPESVAGAGGLRRLVRKPFRPAELAAQLEAAIHESRVTA